MLLMVSGPDMKRNRVQPGVSYSSANGAHGSGYQA